MNRKIEKLTEVLGFADSAGPQVIIYFYQWFDELAGQMSEKPRHDLTLLLSAASRVLKTLFVEKVRDLSAFDSKQQIFGGQFISQGKKYPVKKNSEDIKKMLVNEMIEVAQWANAGWILRAGFETGHNSKSDSHEINSTLKSCT